jgi:hypothetical protein
MEDNNRWTGLEAQVIVANEHEWRKWAKAIPYIKWPSDWEVKAIPPAAGAIVRYYVKTPNCEIVSIYLDCYDILGFMGYPYWEVYAFIDELLRLIDAARTEEE